jgi:uncharacterized protein with ParB-like and HNH nuclease domain
MENILELKTINELSQYSFFIPSYQRGYKWTSKEVIDLLNDIHDFKPRTIGSSEEKTWYCLQPIVVKKLENDKFEVIDGQQRLTTIFLVLNYLNQDFIPGKRDRLFELNYETRKDTKEFLGSLGKHSPEHQNIDFFYISTAYTAIDNWFSSRPPNFDKGEYRSKFKYHSKTIWYESMESNSISIFTRINIGKIPLTNAELIKALFLNSSNFEQEKDEKIKLKLKQLEISTEWDQIEHSLQNDRMWFFLTGSKASTNRIELIFDLMNEEEDENDNYATFRFFNKKFQMRSQSAVEKNWGDIKDYFQRFSEWFNERDLYHKIGFLICIHAINIKDLYGVSSKSSKTEFREYLDDLIRKDFEDVQLEDLQYGDGTISKVLLLYNILTMLASENDNSYFPFDIYRNERWDIEHITSVKDTIPDKNRKEWLKDALAFVDDKSTQGLEIVESAKSCDCDNDAQFKSLFEQIVSHFNSGIADEDINDISNLTLLDSETNRGYKNAVFPFKRKTIINRDKEGIFIPICTKNVFLKYFSEYPPKISFWTQDDREKYEQDLHRVLDSFLQLA